MNDSEFRPSREWLDGPRHHWHALVSVLGRVSGSSAENAVEDFLSHMTQEDQQGTAEGATVWFRGGYSAEVRRPEAGSEEWQVLLSSAGEDGLDSAVYAAWTWPRPWTPSTAPG